MYATKTMLICRTWSASKPNPELTDDWIFEAVKSGSGDYDGAGRDESNAFSISEPGLVADGITLQGTRPGSLWPRPCSYQGRS